MNFRAIGMFCLLLVIIGFFMPWVTQLNGFQTASLMVSQGHNSGKLIYVWFVLALAGFLIGIPLLLKKNVPVFIDLLIVIICFYSSAAFLIFNSGVKIQSGLHAVLIGTIAAFENIQFGFYAILIGTVTALIFPVVSFIKETT